MQPSVDHSLPADPRSVAEDIDCMERVRKKLGMDV